jgi:succinate dehydrogenase/fumarate reductase cytochrome b subunit
VYKNDIKQFASIILYLTGIVIAFFYPVVSLALYVIVAGTWFIPDKRMEKEVKTL